MNRATFAYPFAALTVAGLLSLGFLQTTMAAEQPSSSKPAGAEQPSTIAASAAPAAASAMPAAPKLRFQFRNQAWKDVLEWFAQRLNLSLEMGTPPPGVFNYSDNREYTPTEALELLNRVLTSKGFLLVHQGPTLMLVNLRTAGITVHPTTPRVAVYGRPAPAAESLIEVYRLRYADGDTVMPVLANVFPSDTPVKLSVDGKNNSLIVIGPRAAQETIAKALETLDVPPATKNETQIKIFHLQHVDPGPALNMLLGVLPKGIQFAVDERTRQLIASGPPDSLSAAEALLLRLDQSAEKERPKSSLPYEVRIVWLANDEKAGAPAADLKDVAGELARLGIKNPRQVGEMVVQSISTGRFQIESSPLFKGEPVGFSATGTLREERDAPLTMQIAIKTTTRSSGQSQNLNTIDTQIVAPQKQYVVLATAPVGNVTSAFVLQVVGSSKPAAAK